MIGQRNWRGIAVPDLVCEIQYQQERLEDFKAVPDAFISFIPEGQTQEEYVKESIHFYERMIEGIENELKRRERLQYDGVSHTNKEIIQTIKEKMGGKGLVDVIGWYAEVIVYQNRWKFRCTHGEDKDPSGVIYLDQMKWHCFGCNQGGDVFDAVCYFERVTFPEAIKRLARYLGLDLPKTPQIRGGIEYSPGH